MMVGSRLQWSLRHTRQRLFECILIILAVGLGVAVIVTVVSVFARIDTPDGHSLGEPPLPPV